MGNQGTKRPRGGSEELADGAAAGAGAGADAAPTHDGEAAAKRSRSLTLGWGGATMPATQAFKWWPKTYTQMLSHDVQKKNLLEFHSDFVMGLGIGLLIEPLNGEQITNVTHALTELLALAGLDSSVKEAFQARLKERLTAAGTPTNISNVMTNSSAAIRQLMTEASRHISSSEEASAQAAHSTEEILNEFILDSIERSDKVSAVLFFSLLMQSPAIYFHVASQVISGVDFAKCFDVFDLNVIDMLSIVSFAPEPFSKHMTHQLKEGSFLLSTADFTGPVDDDTLLQAFQTKFIQANLAVKQGMAAELGSAAAGLGR